MVISEKATTEDLLGFEPYVKGIADLVRQTKPSDLPITIGVYGAWGVGKTSFIMQLRKQLQNNKEYQIPTVWFDAWKYDRTNDVRSALLFNILSNLRTETSGTAKVAVTKNFKKVIKAAKILTLDTQFSVGFTGGSVTLPPLGQLIDNVAKAEAFRTSVDQLADGFTEAVNAFLTQYKKDEQKKLVIFVDDLDRCLPEHVITILEALKLFLDRAPCVFVIAVDRAVVEKAVRNHYGSDPGVSGRDYLYKMIQHCFTVPPAPTTQLRQCIRELVKSDGINDKCLQVFDIASEGNPRVYLRLVNEWKLVAAIAPYVVPNLWKDEAIRYTMAIAVSLHLRWPDLRELIINNPKGFYAFVGLCITPPTEQIEIVLTRDHAQEYISFWENSHFRNFLNSLSKIIGENTGQLLNSEEKFKAALELCARGT